ncbi:hypothetical protein EKK58_04880 [Candidatus Dependentiae bacterium]|nr:MAG: hypothetical protein EKK58_04880 [Candidatus Dependentiae bacterium]
MKQNQKNGAYSIAWFKIAECVLRGEKERALGVHRLLSHSLDDQALAMQLEGDIMLACGDIDRALQVYNDAALCYISLKKYEQAAGIYEHMLFLKPTDDLLYNALLKVYIAASINQHIIRMAISYIILLNENNNIPKIKNITEEVLAVLSKKDQVSFASDFFKIPFVVDQERTAIEQHMLKIMINEYAAQKQWEKIDDFIQYLIAQKPYLVDFAKKLKNDSRK